MYLPEHTLPIFGNSIITHTSKEKTRTSTSASHTSSSQSQSPVSELSWDLLVGSNSQEEYTEKTLQAQHMMSFTSGLQTESISPISPTSKKSARSSEHHRPTRKRTRQSITAKNGPINPTAA